MATTAGRPRAFDAGTVLDRAVDLFWKRGYRTTTTRDLEAVLGLSQSSLYNAFGSKHGLFMAALDRYENMTATALLEPLENSDRGLDAIDRFFVALGEWVTKDGRGGCMIINLMAEDGGDSDFVSIRTSAYRRRVRNALRDALGRAADLGETSHEDIGVRADLLFAAVLGLNIAARGGSLRAEVERLAEAARHLIRSWRN